MAFPFIFLVVVLPASGAGSRAFSEAVKMRSLPDNAKSEGENFIERTLVSVCC